MLFNLSVHHCTSTFFRRPITNLINEYDGDILALKKALEAFVDFTHARVFVDDEKIGTPRFVNLADPTQQESRAGVLVADHWTEKDTVPCCLYVLAHNI